MDNVYALNGTFYIVQSDDAANRTVFPERYLMISNGTPRLDDQPAADRAPTDANMQIINATEAKRIFGKFANRMGGTSVSLCRVFKTHSQLTVCSRRLQFVCYDDVKCKFISALFPRKIETGFSLLLGRPTARLWRHETCLGLFLPL